MPRPPGALLALLIVLGLLLIGAGKLVNVEGEIGVQITSLGR